VLANGAITFLTLASGVLVARLLRPEGRGALAKIQMYPSLVAAIGIWGFNQTIARRAARHRDGAGSGKTLGVALAGAGVLALLTMGVYVAVVPFLPLESTHLRWLILIWGVLWIPLNYISLTLLGIDQGTQRWSRFNLTRMVLYPAYLISLLLLASTGTATLTTVAGVLLLSNAIVCAVRLFLSLRDAKPERPRRREVLSQLKEGNGYAVANISGALTAQIDKLLAVMLFPSAAVGLYVVASSVAGALQAPIAGAFALTAFADAAASTKPTPVPARMLWATLIIAAVSAFSALIGPLLLPTVYGRNFAEATAFVPILCLGAAAAGLSNIYEQHYRGAGLPQLATVGRWLCVLAATATILASRGRVGMLSLAYGFAVGHSVRLMWFGLSGRFCRPSETGAQRGAQG